MEPTSERHWEDEPATRVSYRALSASAIVTLLLGIASILALYHPAMWCIPAAALLTAVLALWATSATGPDLAGRPAVVWGLALALLFGSWAPAAYYLERRHLQTQAREFHECWLQLILQGERQDAFDWTLPADRRQAPPPQEQSVAGPSAAPPATADSYFRQGTPRVVAELAGRASWRFVCTLQVDKALRTSTIAQQFELTDKRQSRKVAVVVTSTREYTERTRFAQWQIRDLTMADEFSARP